MPRLVIAAALLGSSLAACANDNLGEVPRDYPPDYDLGRIDPNRIDPADDVDDGPTTSPDPDPDPGSVPDSCQFGAVMGRLCLPGADAPLAGAEVSVSAPDCVGQTVSVSDTASSHGQFALAGLPEGTHTFTVSHPDYTGTFKATVVAGEIVIADTLEDGAPLCLTQGPTRLAVIRGVFDEVENVLGSLGLSHDVYDDEPPGEGMPSPALQFLSDLDAMLAYDAILFNCGDDTRDFLGYEDGLYRYDGPVYTNLRRFTKHGGGVYVADWAWPIAEGLGPDGIDWHGDEAHAPWDVHAGQNPALQGRLVDDGLSMFLATEAVAVKYNLPGWAVIDDVGPDTRVFVVGDVDLMLPPPAQSILRDRPLLVRYQVPDGIGRVLFTSFHYHSQPSEQMMDILRFIIFQL